MGLEFCYGLQTKKFPSRAIALFMFLARRDTHAPWWGENLQLPKNLRKIKTDHFFLLVHSEIFSNSHMH